jgi:hypothetical protein
MACLTNPISQPSLDISPIWIPLINNEITNSSRLVGKFPVCRIFLSTLYSKKQYCNWIKQEVRRRNMAPLHHRQLSQKIIQACMRGSIENVSILWRNAHICVQEILKYAVNSNYYNFHAPVPTYIQFSGTSIHIFKLLATQKWLRRLRRVACVPRAAVCAALP